MGKKSRTQPHLEMGFRVYLRIPPPHKSYQLAVHNILSSTTAMNYTGDSGGHQPPAKHFEPFWPPNGEGVA